MKPSNTSETPKPNLKRSQDIQREEAPKHQKSEEVLTSDHSPALSQETTKVTEEISTATNEALQANNSSDSSPIHSDLITTNQPPPFSDIESPVQLPSPTSGSIQTIIPEGSTQETSPEHVACSVKNASDKEINSMMNRRILNAILKKLGENQEIEKKFHLDSNDDFKNGKLVPGHLLSDLVSAALTAYEVDKSFFDPNLKDMCLPSCYPFAIHIMESLLGAESVKLANPGTPREISYDELQKVLQEICKDISEAPTNNQVRVMAVGMSDHGFCIIIHGDEVTLLQEFANGSTSAGYMSRNKVYTRDEIQNVLRACISKDPQDRANGYSELFDEMIEDRFLGQEPDPGDYEGWKKELTALGIACELQQFGTFLPADDGIYSNIDDDREVRARIVEYIEEHAVNNDEKGTLIEFIKQADEENIIKFLKDNEKSFKFGSSNEDKTKYWLIKSQGIDFDSPDAFIDKLEKSIIDPRITFIANKVTVDV